MEYTHDNQLKVNSRDVSLQKEFTLEGKSMTSLLVPQKIPLEQVLHEYEA